MRAPQTGLRPLDPATRCEIVARSSPRSGQTSQAGQTRQEVGVVDCVVFIMPFLVSFLSAFEQAATTHWQSPVSPSPLRYTAAITPPLFELTLGHFPPEC